MDEPFARSELTDETRVLPFEANVPRRSDEQKNEDAVPAQQGAKPDARFPIKTGEQRQDRRGIKEAVQTFCHTGERGANPEADKPAPPPATAFVAADGAVNRSSDKSAEEWFRHNDPAEEKSAGATKMNQAGEKTAPMPAEAIADEKSERNTCEGGEGDGQAHGRSR